MVSFLQLQLVWVSQIPSSIQEIFFSFKSISHSQSNHDDQSRFFRCRRNIDAHARQGGRNLRAHRRKAWEDGFICGPRGPISSLLRRRAEAGFSRRG
jgi:hypothetical protein